MNFNNIHLEAILLDVSGRLLVDTRTCGDCPSGFSCQIEGFPFSSFSRTWRERNAHKASCFRPLGMVRKNAAITLLTLDYLCATPFVPIRIKLAVGMEILDKIIEYNTANQSEDKASQVIRNSIQKVTSAVLELHKKYGERKERSIFDDTSAGPYIEKHVLEMTDRISVQTTYFASFAARQLYIMYLSLEQLRKPEEKIHITDGRRHYAVFANSLYSAIDAFISYRVQVRYPKHDHSVKACEKIDITREKIRKEYICRFVELLKKDADEKGRTGMQSGQDYLVEIVEQDIKGQLVMPTETCGNCPQALSCQVVGSPDGIVRC